MNKFLEVKLEMEYLALWKITKRKMLHAELHDLVRQEVRKVRRTHKNRQGIDTLLDKSERFGKTGSWASYQLKELAQIVYSDKIPDASDLGQWISIEIECILQNEQKETELVAWIRKQGYSKSITLKGDGSIHPDLELQRGKEIVLSFKYNDWSILEQLCNKLLELNTIVNKTCGLHVHFDCRHLSERQVNTLGNRVARVVPALKDILPKSRRNNKFCETNISTEENDSDPRYAFVNLLAYKRHKTIEIRGHSGTTDALKIKNWIRILRQIMESQNTKAITSTSELINKFKFDSDLVSYITERYEKFASMPLSTNDDIAQDNNQNQISDGQSVRLILNSASELRAIAGIDMTTESFRWHNVSAVNYPEINETGESVSEETSSQSA